MRFSYTDHHSGPEFPRIRGLPDIGNIIDHWCAPSENVQLNQEEIFLRHELYLLRTSHCEYISPTAKYDNYITCYNIERDSLL